MTSPDELLAEIARETAANVVVLATERTLSWVNERDHLQPSATLAAHSVVGQLREAVTVSPSRPCASPTWPRLGRLDLALLRDGDTPVAIELKSGAGRDALAACAWDAVKLAHLLDTEAVGAAYLVAATPTSDWSSSYRGTEFFTTRTFSTLDLREPYLDWWRKWERDGYAAGSSLPAAFATRAVARVPFVVGTTPWQIAVAAVEVDAAELITWMPTLVAR